MFAPGSTHTALTTPGKTPGGARKLAASRMFYESVRWCFIGAIATGISKFPSFPVCAEPPAPFPASLAYGAEIKRHRFRESSLPASLQQRLFARRSKMKRSELLRWTLARQRERESIYIIQLHGKMCGAAVDLIHNPLSDVVQWVLPFSEWHRKFNQSSTTPTYCPAIEFGPLLRPLGSHPKTILFIGSAASSSVRSSFDFKGGMIGRKKKINETRKGERKTDWVS